MAMKEQITTPEVVRQPMRLSHFSVGEGSSYLRQRLLERVEQPQSVPSAAQNRLARDTSALKAADRFIEYIINTAFPQEKYRASLLNETTLLAPDAERALKVIEANGDTDARLKFEWVRKMLLAGVAREIEDRSLAYQIRSELHDVHTLLDEKLFAGKIGQTWETTTYAVHKKSTNETKSVSDTYPMFIRPGHTVKKFTQESRYVEGVGYVLSSIREKTRESSILKTLRRAVQKREKSGSDELDALSAVKDSMGLMFVVKGTMDSQELRVEVLKHKVLDLLQERYGEIIIHDDNENGSKQYNGQTTHANYQRLQVHVESLPVPIELIFYGEGSYINDTYNVGKKARKMKKYTGNAHTLFEIDRIRQVLPVIYPKTVEGTEIKGYQDLAEETLQTMRAEARRLKKDKKVMLGRRVAERVKSQIVANKREKTQPRFL